jgi:hypothetical protein
MRQLVSLRQATVGATRTGWLGGNEYVFGSELITGVAVRVGIGLSEGVSVACSVGISVGTRVGGSSDVGRGRGSEVAVIVGEGGMRVAVGATAATIWWSWTPIATAAIRVRVTSPAASKPPSSGPSARLLISNVPERSCACFKLYPTPTDPHHHRVQCVHLGSSCFDAALWR